MKTNWPALRNGCLILASLACGTAPLLAQSQESAGATATSAVISSVAVTQASQHASVRVQGEGRLDAHAVRMQNPDRLVLDFVGARMAVQRTVIPGISAPVLEVRLGRPCAPRRSGGWSPRPRLASEGHQRHLALAGGDGLF